MQLGTDPRQAVVLRLPHPAAARLLDLLDGSRTSHAVVTEMRRMGMPEDDAQAALTALSEAGVVLGADSLIPTAVPADRREQVTTEAAALALRHRTGPASPAQVMRRRYAARVIIAGHGPMAGLLTSVLAEAGVGTVGRLTEPGGKAVPVVSVGRARTVRADDAFVVQLGQAVQLKPRGARRRLPLLAVGVRDAVAIVGPLVPPDRGPCLRCLDLHRTDRDPAWPRLAAQLGAAPGPCAAATWTTAAGFAAAEVLTYLDGGSPTTIGTTVEIDGVAPWRRREWPPHPHCDCTRRRRSAPTDT